MRTFSKEELTRIYRVKSKEGHCQTLGIAESYREGKVTGLTSFNGFLVRETLDIELCHTRPCKDCPPDRWIKDMFFQPGIDVRSFGKTA